MILADNAPLILSKVDMINTLRRFQVILNDLPLLRG